MQKLFSITSKMDGLEYHGYVFDGVTVHWCCADRQHPLVDPKKGIEGYDHTDPDGHAVAALDELFSEEEAKALQNQLLGWKETTETRTKKVDLPLPTNSIPCSAIPMGRWEGVWEVRSKKFHFDGYFDVREGTPRKLSVCPACGAASYEKIKAQPVADANELPPCSQGMRHTRLGAAPERVKTTTNAP